MFWLFSEDEDGVFLVRESNTSPGDYVLSVLHQVITKKILLAHANINNFLAFVQLRLNLFVMFLE